MNQTILLNFTFHHYIITTSNELNTSGEQIWTEFIKPSLFATLYAFILVFGIVFNSIIIIIYTQKKHIKNFSKYLFINLSVSDIIVLSVCIPRAITDLFTDGEWKLGYLYCKFYFMGFRLMKKFNKIQIFS